EICIKKRENIGIDDFAHAFWSYHPFAPRTPLRPTALIIELLHEVAVAGSGNRNIHIVGTRRQLPPHCGAIAFINPRKQLSDCVCRIFSLWCRHTPCTIEWDERPLNDPPRCPTMDPTIKVARRSDPPVPISLRDFCRRCASERCSDNPDMSRRN